MRFGLIIEFILLQVTTIYDKSFTVITAQITQGTFNLRPSAAGLLSIF
jgi:hypothetical protein